jgi:hypothetical protein
MNVVRFIANNPVHTRIYNVLFRNTSTIVATVLVSSVVLESVVDSTVNQAWNVANRGVTFAFLCFLLFSFSSSLLPFSVVSMI